MIPYKQITIDLVPEVMPPEPLLTASQYDNGRPVEVTVQYGGQDYDLTGMTAKIEVRKPSGKVVIADAAQVSGSKVTFNLITQMTAEHGQVLTELSLTGQDQEPIGTANWITYVEKSPASGSPSDTWVQDINEKVEQAVEAAEAAENSALDAEAWAVGERDGEPVTDQDETYQNNAKYYALSSIAAKEAAEAAASAAVESARSAADSATYASGSAESASGSATASASSATQAAGSATAAASSASAAAQSAGAAAQSATESAGYATASENSAGVSAGAAEAARQSATAAAGSASTAAGHATNASASATASAGSASDAAQSATASAGSATAAAGSATAAAGSAEAADASADRAQEILDSIPEDYSELSEDVSDLKSAISAVLITETASGSVVTIDDGADGIDSKGYTLTIEPHQAGSGDPSPDNVRPITGYTSVKTVRAWGNIIDNTPLPVTLSGSNFVNLALPPGTLQRLIESNVPVTLHIDGVLGEGKTQYAIYAPSGSNNSPILIGDGFVLSESNNFTRSGTMQIQGAPVSYVYADILRIYVQPYAGSATSTINSVQFCVGDTVIAESGALTESIPFPSEAGTVYGGTLTKNADGSGTLTVTGEVDTIGYANGAWLSKFFGITTGQYSTNIGTVTRTPFNYTTTPPSVNINRRSDAYQINANNMLPHAFNYALDSPHYYINGQYYLYLPISCGETWEEVSAWLVDHHVQTWVEYTTPQTYTIPAEDMAKIPTLKGDNTVWMSADGSISLDYYADTKLYIDKLTAPDEDMIANENIPSGAYFSINNTLYLSTAAIAAGASIIPGTNCTETNIAAALNAVNA